MTWLPTFEKQPERERERERREEVQAVQTVLYVESVPGSVLSRCK
jgi:hypothetical protein